MSFSPVPSYREAVANLRRKPAVGSISDKFLLREVTPATVRDINNRHTWGSFKIWYLSPASVARVLGGRR